MGTVAGGDRAVALGRVQAVGVHVGDVVDEVGAAGRRAHGDERRRACATATASRPARQRPPAPRSTSTFFNHCRGLASRTATASERRPGSAPVPSLTGRAPRGRRRRRSRPWSGLERSAGPSLLHRDAHGHPPAIHSVVRLPPHRALSVRSSHGVPRAAGQRNVRGDRRSRRLPAGGSAHHVLPHGAGPRRRGLLEHPPGQLPHRRRPCHPPPRLAARYQLVPSGSPSR